MSETDEWFNRQWLALSQICISRMEPHDRRIIRSFRNFDDVQEHVFEKPDETPDEASSQTLLLLQPRLVDLRHFSDYCTQSFGQTFNHDVFWGLLGLALTIAMQNEQAMRRVANMLRKLGRHCQDFEAHTSSTSSSTTADREACLEILISMTRLWCDVVSFLRSVGDMSQVSYTPVPHSHSWEDLTGIFDHTESEIKESLSRVERIAAISQKRNPDVSSLLSLLGLSPPALLETTNFPCYVLPPARISRFFNRDDVIERIDKQFNDQDSSPFRSLALYGMGGVGKTHVALKYAEKRQWMRDLDVILWIHAENLIAIQQSFTEIALRLKLPGTRTDAHSQNRILLTDWLQQTERKWLLIYDNAEDGRLLQDYWPLPGSKGQVLITTRNHSIAFNPADSGLEVLPWDTPTGSKFIMHLLANHISSDILTSEEKSSLELAEKLSGHALALSNMCGLIHRRSWTIREVLELYDRSKDLTQGLDAVWRVSFQNLSKDGATLLGVFSLCAPDSIPHSLFDPDDPGGLPEHMKWLLEEKRLSNAIEELLVLALVKRDRHTRTYSIHRLIQSQYLHFLQPEDRQQSFIEASILMFEVFPKRSASTGNLYDVWDRCRLWLQHVLNLKTNFRRERQNNPQFYACTQTCATWIQCQRFLLEDMNFQDLEDLVAVNRIATATLPEQDPEFYILSATETHVAQMSARMGRYDIAIERMTEARRIKLSAPLVDLRNISFNEIHLGGFHSCRGDLERALEWNDIGLDTWQRWASANDGEDCPPWLRINRGRILAYLGRYDEALEVLSKALNRLKANKALTWAITAMGKFCLGRLAMFKKEHERAESLFMETQSTWLQGDQSQTHAFNGATMYRIGCCALLQGNVEAAVKHLQDARAITSLHKDILVGEHARCLYKMSEAIRQFPGREEEADRLLDEAEKLYRKRVHDTRTGQDGSGLRVGSGSQLEHIREEDYDMLVFMDWR